MHRKHKRSTLFYAFFMFSSIEVLFVSPFHRVFFSPHKHSNCGTMLYSCNGTLALYLNVLPDILFANSWLQSLVI
ncbi:hypothetical protein BKA57DRAFT_457137, partial [Linnemannia elongata]